MTSLSNFDHLLTIEEWEQLTDDEYRHAELVEGVLQVSPSAGVPHQLVSFGLSMQLAPVCGPLGLVPLADLDVLIDPSFPATIRQPDISVVPLATANQRSKRLDRSDVVLAIEIVSPGSGRRDRVMKLHEYAGAGIGNYWIFDIDGPAIILDAFALDGATYRSVAQAAGGSVALDAPFAITLDLAALRAW